MVTFGLVDYNRGMKRWNHSLNSAHARDTLRGGFTIVELLVVVVVIAILAAVTIVSYNGIAEQSRQTKAKEDIAHIVQAIIVARDNTGKSLDLIIGNPYGVGGTVPACQTGVTAGADFSTLPSNGPCWTTYNNALNAISVASGINIRGMVDPWGWPYFIMGVENARCAADTVGVWRKPYTGGQSADLLVKVPRSGYTPNCA